MYNSGYTLTKNIIDMFKYTLRKKKIMKQKPTYYLINSHKIIRRRWLLFSLACSKRFFRNASGLVGNSKGFITKKIIKKIDFDNQNFEINQKAHELAAEGHVKFENFYDPQLIHQISTRLNELIDEEKNVDIIAREGEQIFCKKFLYPIPKIPELKNLVNDKVIDFLKSYYKSYFKITRLFIWRNYHIPSDLQKKREMYSNWWHCDPENSTWVKLFVNLTDVTEKNGPFHALTKARTKELIKMGYGNRGNYKLPSNVMDDPKHVWKSTGDAGTAFMCNCVLGFHRAGIPEPGCHRDLVVLIFAPSNKPMRKDWWKDVDFSEYFV